MFVGHLALAFAGKRTAPDLSLGWLVAGVTALDLVWPVLLLAGVERVTIAPGATAFTPFIFEWYPWSHSLVMSVVIGLVLAAVARWRGIRGSAAPLLVALVVSHWALDFASHAPDMPLWPGRSPRFGLGLWNSIGGTLIIEGAMWVTALAVYLRGRRAHGRLGSFAFWSFVTICTVLWVSGPWTPPPPDTRTLAWFALIGWLTVPWAAWADRQMGSGE